jgi:predicted phosphodiesterase
MLVAVISDIHSNLPAFEAVLAAIDRSDPKPDQVWCLGDIVGYGADPDACASLTAERADLCLAGNHDLVVSGDIDIGHFSRSAAAAARWTMSEISDETRSFLSPLEPAASADGVGLYHASPRDHVWEYVLSFEQARRCLDVQPERICLIGHSHVALFFGRRGAIVEGDLAPGGTDLDVGEGEWLLNPGSVGQPRDLDAKAAYLTLDTDRWIASFHRIEYPIQQAADAIEEAGLPVDLAHRLYEGQ